MSAYYLKKVSVLGIIIFLLTVFIIPVFVSAQASGLVYECPNGNCTFNDLIAAIINVINWATTFAVAFSVVVIAVAGGRYMISGANPGERKKANDMLVKTVKGLFFILAAWLIVRLITSTLIPSVNTFLG